MRKSYHYWWIRFTTPDGKEVRRSTGTQTKKDAEEYEANLKQELWRVARLGEKPKHSWQEAVVRFCEETAHKHSHEDDLCNLRWIGPHLKQFNLDRIDIDVIEEIIKIRKAGGVKNRNNQPYPRHDPCHSSPCRTQMALD